jgi:hypothetical protein
MEGGNQIIDVAEYKVMAPQPVTTKRKLSHSADVDLVNEVLRLVRSEDFQEQLKSRPNERDQLVELLAPKINVLVLLDCTGESMPQVIVNSKSKLTKDEINALHNSNPTSRAE